MKNTKPTPTLEEMLATVEHAGRDARRRDELAAMINSMAGINRHGFWWWTVRVAAAACVLFFVSTAVRIWFIPTDSAVDGNLVAQAEVPEVIPAAVDTMPTAPAVPQPVCVQRNVVLTEVVEMEEYVAEKVQVEPEREVSVVEEQNTVIIIEEVVAPGPAPIAQAEPVNAIAVPIVSAGNTPAAPAEESKPKHESIFKSLIRRHEPSRMDGTMLALSIL